MMLSRTTDIGVKARFLEWRIAEPRGDQPHILRTLGPATVSVVVDVRKPVRGGHHGILLYTHERQLVWGWAADKLDLEVGKHEFCYTFPMLPVRPGPYTWLVSLWEAGSQLDAWECSPEMVVAAEDHQHHRDEWRGLLNMPFEFRIREPVEIATTISPDESS